MEDSKYFKKDGWKNPSNTIVKPQGCTPCIRMRKAACKHNQVFLYKKKNKSKKLWRALFYFFCCRWILKKIGSIRVTLINWRLATVISSHLQVFKIKHRIRGSFFTVFLSSSFKFMLAALTNVAAYMSSQHRQGARQRQGPLCSICGLKSKREAVRCTNASQREVSSVL